MSVFKAIVAVLLVITCHLQYRLWVGAGSLAETDLLQSRAERMTSANEILEHRNGILRAEIVELRNGLDAIEEKARSELGMIKEGETFFLLVDSRDAGEN